MSGAIRSTPVCPVFPGCSPKASPTATTCTELGRYYRAYAQLMDHWRSVLPEERYAGSAI